MEQCARMNCDQDAVALLSFAPRQAKAWLSDLTAPNPATGIVLCRRHANATVVPMSWQLVDARDPGWSAASERGAFSSEVAAPTQAPSSPVSTSPARTDRMPNEAARLEGEFAAIDSPFPVASASSVPGDVRGSGSVDQVADQTPIGDDPIARRSEPIADPSLFELPLDDMPAVTPHPGW